MPRRRWEQTRTWTNLHLPYQIIIRTEDFTFRQFGPLNALADDVAEVDSRIIAGTITTTTEIDAFAWSSNT